VAVVQSSEQSEPSGTHIKETILVRRSLGGGGRVFFASFFTKKKIL